MASVGAFTWFVWPTPWKYETELWESPLSGIKRKVPVRIRTHRLTGEKQNQAGPAGVWGHVW
jgi:hypothetical protein